MIRTVWLATVCLAVVSAVATGKALRTPAEAIVAERSADQATVGIGSAQDTLTKADRLEIAYARQERLPQPASQPTEPAVPVVSPSTPPIEPKIISRHWRDPNAFSSSAKKSKQTKQTIPSKKSKTADRKGNQAADRSKPAEPAKPCSRPGTFGNFLRSLNLSPACDS
jgi:hypothetical protein